MKLLVRENERIPIKLSPKQISLINEHTFAEDSLQKFLNTAVVDGKRREAKLALHDLEDLAGHIAAAANHCEDRAIQIELDAIIAILDKTQSKYDIQYD